MGGQRGSRVLRKEGLPGSRIREMALQSPREGGWTESGVQAVLNQGAVRKGRSLVAFRPVWFIVK